MHDILNHGDEGEALDTTSLEGDLQPSSLGPLHIVFGNAAQNSDLASLHPSNDSISYLWHSFVENVHPVTCLLHVPSMGRLIQRAKNDMSSLNKSSQSLLFAVYHAAVVPLSIDEVRQHFGEEKQVVQARFRDATQHALTMADFLKTQEISNLQALVLFLIWIRG